MTTVKLGYVREKHQRDASFRIETDQTIDSTVGWTRNRRAVQMQPDRASVNWQWEHDHWQISDVFFQGRLLRKDGTVGVQSVSCFMPMDDVPFPELVEAIHAAWPSSTVEGVVD